MYTTVYHLAASSLLTPPAVPLACDYERSWVETSLLQRESWNMVRDILEGG